MKLLVIVLSTIVSLVVVKSADERSTESQIQKNEVDHHTDAMSKLSNAVNAITDHLDTIVQKMEIPQTDDVQLSIYPLEDVITYIWSAPSDKLFHERLYFLFDKLLDIVYCKYEKLDDAWHGVSYLIESKLSRISLCILRIVDEMKTLEEESEDKQSALDGVQFNTINETIADLTTSIVGLTSITTLTTQMITTRDRSISLIIETITSLVLIHQYAVAAVVCLLSRAVMYPKGLLHAPGIATLATTIVDFISKLESVLRTKQKEATMTQLFHGDLHIKLSMQLLVTMNDLISTKIINMIHTSTVSILHVIKEYATESFHILPDLIEQLTVISLRCGHTEFDSLDMFITYAFDGLFDVLHHISYKLDKHLQSSASTGSFQEPSEPIEMAVTNVKIEMKRFIYDFHQAHDSEVILADLIASTSDLMEAVLDPMHIIVQNSDDDDAFRITLASSLQFIALYVIGLILTPLISLTNSLQSATIVISDTYSSFRAALSLLFIKIETMFDFSKTQYDVDILKRLYESFDDLRQNLVQMDALNERTKAPRVVNAFLQLVVEHKSETPFSES